MMLFAFGMIDPLEMSQAEAAGRKCYYKKVWSRGKKIRKKVCYKKSRRYKRVTKKRISGSLTYRKCFAMKWCAKQNWNNPRIRKSSLAKYRRITQRRHPRLVASLNKKILKNRAVKKVKNETVIVRNNHNEKSSSALPLKKRQSYERENKREKRKHHYQPKQREIACMEKAILTEARGESEKGMREVAKVVISRMKSSLWPNSVCGVFYDKKHGVQFHGALISDSKLRRTLKKEKITRNKRQQIYRVAKEVVLKQQESKYLFYKADWARGNTGREHCPKKQIGTHIFYKDCGLIKVAKSKSKRRKYRKRNSST